MHCLSVMPRAGCILPLRILTVVRWFSARPVIAPYGGNWQCIQLIDKFLFDLLRTGRIFVSMDVSKYLYAKYAWFT